VKYRIADAGAVEAALVRQRHGIRLGQETVQDDQASAREGWAYGDDKLGVSFVRLRTVGDAYLHAQTAGRECPLLRRTRDGRGGPGRDGRPSSGCTWSVCQGLWR
jgi:hypothetical protein